MANCVVRVMDPMAWKYKGCGVCAGMSRIIREGIVVWLSLLGGEVLSLFFSIFPSMSLYSKFLKKKDTFSLYVV